MRIDPLHGLWIRPTADGHDDLFRDALMDAERTEGMAQPVRADFGKTGGSTDPVDVAAERVFSARVDELRRSVGGFDKLAEPVNEDRHVAPGGCVFVGAFILQTVFPADSRAADVDDFFPRVDAAPAQS